MHVFIYQIRFICKVWKAMGEEKSCLESEWRGKTFSLEKISFYIAVCKFLGRGT